MEKEENKSKPKSGMGKALLAMSIMFSEFSSLMKGGDKYYSNSSNKVSRKKYKQSGKPWQ